AAAAQLGIRRQGVMPVRLQPLKLSSAFSFCYSDHAVKITPNPLTIVSRVRQCIAHKLHTTPPLPKKTPAGTGAKVPSLSQGT
ncbi:septal ring lytic transglycosylase RlpA family protein, partial [Pseudomonas aeruginosa]|uniref:septal ring lytic transglycosylase RlpA family protein n=1 Tax=Pseudomonas aeruginosa TaxID=287 RepID=UPI001E5C10BE